MTLNNNQIKALASKIYDELKKEISDYNASIDITKDPKYISTLQNVETLREKYKSICNKEELGLIISTNVSIRLKEFPGVCLESLRYTNNLQEIFKNKLQKPFIKMETIINDLIIGTITETDPNRLIETLVNSYKENLWK